MWTWTWKYYGATPIRPYGSNRTYTDASAWLSNRNRDCSASASGCGISYGCCDLRLFSNAARHLTQRFSDQDYLKYLRRFLNLWPPCFSCSCVARVALTFQSNVAPLTGNNEHFLRLQPLIHLCEACADETNLLRRSKRRFSCRLAESNRISLRLWASIIPCGCCVFFAAQKDAAFLYIDWIWFISCSLLRGIVSAFSGSHCNCFL